MIQECPTIDTGSVFKTLNPGNIGHFATVCAEGDAGIATFFSIIAFTLDVKIIVGLSGQTRQVNPIL